MCSRCLGCRRVARVAAEELSQEGPKGLDKRTVPQSGDPECSAALANQTVCIDPEEGSALFKTQFPPAVAAKHESWAWIPQALRERHPAALGALLSIIVLVVLLTCGLVLVELGPLRSLTSHRSTTELAGSNGEPAKASGPSPSVDPCSVGACRPGCAMPCQGASEFPACLCLFDIDRTLTGKQGSVKECPGNVEVPGVLDQSGGTAGNLVLSNLAQSIEGTFCKKCFRGVVSVGGAGGHSSEEREVVMQILGGEEAVLREDWSSAGAVASALVLGALESRLDEAVRSIVAWFDSEHHVTIEDGNVHYFDDKAQNVQLFTKTGFNAHQVACARPASDAIGQCGAVAEEIVEANGVSACPQT